MNLLKNYLKKIIEVEKIEEEWTKEDWAKNKEWVRVMARFSCHGNERMESKIFTREEWEDVKEKGYYMG